MLSDYEAISIVQGQMREIWRQTAMDRLADEATGKRSLRHDLAEGLRALAMRVESVPSGGGRTPFPATR
jgi:hypothetical protein